MVLVAELLLPIHELRTPTPGAKTSMMEPKLEKLARASLLPEAATVIASVSEAGEELLASALSFPAATTTVTPAAMVERTAEFTAEETPPPRDIERTELAALLVATHWIPEMTPELLPDPEALRTLTATRLTALETPYVEPPMVPAQ